MGWEIILSATGREAKMTIPILSLPGNLTL